jgi:hypothetical protein
LCLPPARMHFWVSAHERSIAEQRSSRLIRLDS